MPSVLDRARWMRLSSDVWFGDTALSSPLGSLHPCPPTSSPSSTWGPCAWLHNLQVSQGSCWERFTWLMLPCAWANWETVTLPFYSSPSYEFPDGFRTRSEKTGQWENKSYHKEIRISKSGNGPWTLLKVTSVWPSAYFGKIFINLQSAIFP